MGFIGYFVKLIHIPMFVPPVYPSSYVLLTCPCRNNILVYVSNLCLLTHHLCSHTVEVHSPAGHLKISMVRVVYERRFIADWPSCLFGKYAKIVFEKHFRRGSFNTLCIPIKYLECTQWT